VKQLDKLGKEGTIIDAEQYAVLNHLVSCLSLASVSEEEAGATQQVLTLALREAEKPEKGGQRK
jgi:hypothetical protein